MPEANNQEKDNALVTNKLSKIVNLVSHDITLYIRLLVFAIIAIPTYMVRPALQGKSLIGKQGKLHTYIRPFVEAWQLLALMEFAAHFLPYQYNGLLWPKSPSGFKKCSCPPLSPSSYSIHAIW